MPYLIYSIALFIFALLVSPTFRRSVSNKLFSVGYFLYTTQIAGYTLHQATYMSSSTSAYKPHSKIDEIRTYGRDTEQIKIVPIPILEDNYCYLVLHLHSKTAALVDPADPLPIQHILQNQYAEFQLTHILTTHKHWDHAGGNIELAKAYPKLTIVGGVGEGVAAATKECTTGDVVDLASHFKAHIYQCPCHTRGHILFRIGDVLFTGDTLFAAGCGKFFEGNAAEMYKNLYETISPLGDSTFIFPGHEYTQSNLEFATFIEPQNEAIADKLRWSVERRKSSFPTIPTTLGEEKIINPFMRVKEPSVIERVSKLSNLQVGSTPTPEQNIRILDAIRTLKNDNAHKKK